MKVHKIKGVKKYLTLRILGLVETMCGETDVYDLQVEEDDKWREITCENCLKHRLEVKK